MLQVPSAQGSSNGDYDTLSDIVVDDSRATSRQVSSNDEGRNDQGAEGPEE